MRYLTHQFAHSETLDRAWRWLIHAGVSPNRMEVYHQGVPRLAVAAEAAEFQSIEMIIRIAEMNDPDGLPGFWDLAGVHPVEERPPTAATPIATVDGASFSLGWREAEADWDDELREQVERQRAYREGRA